jgi:DNA-binding NarL/FixJ family response regulator
MRLLLVDDHALFREGLASLFRYQDDFSVAGEAADAAEAVARARALQPEVILLDLDLPGADGIDAIPALREAAPTAAVVVLTVHDEPDRLFAAIRAGAHGYLVKNVRSRELVAQLRGLAHGEAAIDRRLATQILDEFRRQPVPSAPPVDLTPRELEVLDLVATRLANKEIAKRLNISEHTVKNHLKSILAKLHLRNRREAAAYSLAQGWVRRPTGGGD